MLLGDNGSGFHKATHFAQNTCNAYYSKTIPLKRSLWTDQILFGEILHQVRPPTIDTIAQASSKYKLRVWCTAATPA